MRERLGESLRYIVSQAAGRVPIDDGLHAFLERLERGPVRARAFGAYHDLVMAFEADALGDAAGFLREIAGTPPRPSYIAVVALRGPGDPDSDRFRRLVDTDPGMPFPLAPPSPYAASAADSRIGAALDLLERGHPDLAEEIRALIGEIVLAAPPTDDDVNQFDGASAFMLWGAVALNCESHTTILDMVQALAHESAHNLLFGFSADGPLVENDDAERFDSPLRADPRPLDGVYHATFVTARMHHAVHRLRAADVLDAHERAVADASLEGHAKAFEGGIRVVDRHGRLTAVGGEVMAGARAYMARAGRVG